MNTSKFKQHLESSLELLLKETQQICYNSLSQNFKFIIEPSGREFYEGLDKFEARNLVILNSFSGKHLTSKEAIDLLCHDNRVPLWINMTIYESKQNLTIVHLLCSRRMRNDRELYYQAVKYPPFNVLIPIPPDSIKRDSDGQVDISWKKQSDEALKSKNILSTIKRLILGSK